MLAVLPATMPINGKPSGEAYVEFVSPDEATRALQAKNKVKRGVVGGVDWRGCGRYGVDTWRRWRGCKVLGREWRRFAVSCSHATDVI